MGVGSGWLVIALTENGNAHLHIVMSTEDAKFDADEVWLQQTSGCLCCKKRNRQVKARYGSSHSQSLQVTTLNCLFSPSSHLVDSSELDVYFGQAKPATVPAVQRHPSGFRTETGSCLGSSKQGKWQKEVAFQHDLQKMMEKSLMSVNDQASYKFPDIEAVQDREERCQRISKYQMVTFQYVSPGGTLEDFQAWASSEESLVNVMTFSMALSVVCTEIAPPANVERASSGIASLLGAPQTKIGKMPLKSFKPSGGKSKQLISLDKQRLCRGLGVLIFIGIALCIVFALVLPRTRLNNALNSGMNGYSNNSSL